MSSLKLENLSYRYKSGTKNALDRVNAEFNPWQVAAVMGSSGSGKTTLLSLMAGLDRATEGEIYIDEEALTTLDLDAYRRNRISMIFQSFHLFPLLTVLENVCFTMEINGAESKMAQEEAERLLLSLGISREKHKRYPSKLSGGEQQRVAIARSLASGARVLLADEPTGNLDKANGEKIMEIFQMLAHEKGYTVIIVTHNPEIAASADFVWKMSDGQLELEESAS